MCHESIIYPYAIGGRKTLYRGTRKVQKLFARLIIETLLWRQVVQRPAYTGAVNVPEISDGPALLTEFFRDDNSAHPRIDQGLTGSPEMYIRSRK